MVGPADPVGGSPTWLDCLQLQADGPTMTGSTEGPTIEDRSGAAAAHPLYRFRRHAAAATDDMSGFGLMRLSVFLGLRFCLSLVCFRPVGHSYDDV